MYIRTDKSSAHPIQVLLHLYFILFNRHIIDKNQRMSMSLQNDPKRSLSKSNHFVIKKGKLAIREEALQRSVNYQWIPSSQINKPMPQDYYRETVRRLQEDLRDLMQTLQKKEKEWSNKFYQQGRGSRGRYGVLNYDSDRLKREHEYQIKRLEDSLKHTKQELSKKEISIREQYQYKLKYTAEQLKIRQQELLSKENQLKGQKFTLQKNILLVSNQLREKDLKLIEKNNELILMRSQYQAKNQSSNILFAHKNLYQSQYMNESNVSQGSNHSDQKIKELNDKLRQKERQLFSKQRNFRKEIKSIHQELQHVHKRLIEAELRIGLQQNEIHMKQEELEIKDNQMYCKQQEIRKKDKLIQYQLGVIDKMILQIQQKQKQEQLFLGNPEEMTFGQKLSNTPHLQINGKIQPIEIRSYIQTPQDTSEEDQEVLISEVLEVVKMPHRYRENLQATPIQDYPNYKSKDNSLIQLTPLSLQVPLKGNFTYPIKHSTSDRNDNKYLLTGEAFNEQINGTQVKSRGSEEILSQNLNTWFQWASNNLAGHTFFSDLIEQKETSKQQKTSQDEIEHVSGGANATL